MSGELKKTRLSLIESQPKKVVVVVVVVFVVVVVVFVVIIIVGHKKLALKFGQNRVNNKSDVLFVVILLVLFLHCCL